MPGIEDGEGRSTSKSERNTFADAVVLLASLDGFETWWFVDGDLYAWVVDSGCEGFRLAAATVFDAADGEAGVAFD